MTVITCGLSADAFWGQIKAHAATRNIVPAHRPPVTDLSVINICSLFDVRNICSCPQLANASPPPRTRSQAQQQQNRPNCDTHIETCCHGVKKKHRSVTKLLHLIRRSSISSPNERSLFSPVSLSGGLLSAVAGFPLRAGFPRRCPFPLSGAAGSYHLASTQKQHRRHTPATRVTGLRTPSQKKKNTGRVVGDPLPALRAEERRV